MKSSALWQGIKTRGPIVGICVAIVIACASVLLTHYLGGDQEDVVSMMEQRLLDLRFQMRGELPPSGKVGILAIDERSIQKFGRFPFTRGVYDQAFANLKKVGADWIGFDVVFSEPERPELKDAKPHLEALKAISGKNYKAQLDSELAAVDALFEASPADRRLAEGIANYEKIVLGFFNYESKAEADTLGNNPFRNLDSIASAEVMTELPQGKTIADYSLINVSGFVGNIPEIAAASEHHGFFSNEQTSAITRWVTMVRGLDGLLFPSLSLKMSSNILGRAPYVVFDNLGIESLLLIDEEDPDTFTEVPLDPLGTGRILVNHLGPGRTIPHFSLADAYDNSFTKKERKQLKNMHLLLGPTALGINDQRPNPFDASIAGVENHAAVVDNIISNRFMKRARNIYETELILCVTIGLLFTLLMVFGRAAISGAAAVLFLVGYYYFDKYYWFGRGQWVYMGMPFIEILSMYVCTTLYKYMTEEKEKRRIKGAFAHYLSPEVIDDLLDDPDNLRLGGEKKNLTVFFSDVRGFTTISETLAPETLCDLMNAYFTPMTSIILRNKGVLDKYIGDAIMAFWGAPLQISNHADMAAKSCIEMLFAMDRMHELFKERGFPPIDIGIGLNTGPMSVGNMGSDERFCYTVMGDAVNLGARLEGTTKVYGVKVLISEFTRKQLSPGAFYTRDIDDIKVKGKTEPIKVFELMRPDYLPNERAMQNLIGEFEEGRKAYVLADFDKAEKHFKACFLLKSTDGPTKEYMDRISQYRAAPPPAEWDGVYVRTAK